MSLMDYCILKIGDYVTCSDIITRFNNYYQPQLTELHTGMILLTTLFSIFIAALLYQDYYLAKAKRAYELGDTKEFEEHFKKVTNKNLKSQQDKPFFRK